jgi:hypothetical protein
MKLELKIDDIILTANAPKGAEIEVEDLFKIVEGFFIIYGFRPETIENYYLARADEILMKIKKEEQCSNQCHSD